MKVKRQGWYFTQVNNQAICDNSLSTIEKMVYVSLSMFADTRDNSCYPSYAKIAEYASCSRRSAIDAVKKLQTKGYIEREYRYDDTGSNTSNVFILLDNPGGGCSTDTRVVQEVHEGSAGESPKQEPLNENHITIEDSGSDEPVNSATAAPTLPTKKTKPLPEQKDPIAAQWEAQLTQHTPAAAWKNIPMERGNAKRLSKALQQLGFTADSAAMPSIVQNMVEKYIQLKDFGKSDYWKTAPVTPSGVYARWAQLIEAVKDDAHTYDSGNVEVQW